MPEKNNRPFKDKKPKTRDAAAVQADYEVATKALADASIARKLKLIAAEDPATTAMRATADAFYLELMGNDASEENA